MKFKVEMMRQVLGRLSFVFVLWALLFAGVFHLGSSSLMTDQDGSLVRQQYGYRAFGSERFSLNILPSFTSRFTGQPFDADTGLYYYQSRYYDPELGRFIQPDSIVPDPTSSQSLNRYSYVLNNPLKYIDPTGHAEQAAGWGQPSFGSGSLGFGSGPNWLVGGMGGSLGFGTGLNWVGLYGGAGGWLGAGMGSDWLGLGWQAGGYRTSELPSSMADPYAHWDYSRQFSVGESVKTVASVALLAVPGGAPLRIISAPLRIARAAAAARVGAFVAPRAMGLAAKSGPRRTAQSFLQEVAARAERRIGGTGAVAGTEKHVYAAKLIERYQRRFGPVGGGLAVEQSYRAGRYLGPNMNLAGSVRLDVVEGALTSPSAVFDFKFTINPNPVLSPARIKSIRVNAGLSPNVPITVVHP